MSFFILTPSLDARDGFSKESIEKMKGLGFTDFDMRVLYLLITSRVPISSRVTLESLGLPTRELNMVREAINKFMQKQLVIGTKDRPQKYLCKENQYLKFDYFG